MPQRRNFRVSPWAAHPALGGTIVSLLLPQRGEGQIERPNKKGRLHCHNFTKVGSLRLCRTDTKELRTLII